VNYICEHTAPLGKGVGFIKCDIHRVVDEFIVWQKELSSKFYQGRYDLSKELIGEKFPYALKKLLPLSIEIKRYLFLQSSNGWTIFFNYHISGSDLSEVEVLTTRLNCEGIEAIYCPRSADQLGASQFALFDDHKCNEYNNLKRLISLIDEGDKWQFDQEGELLPFENPEIFKNRLKQNRFTLIHLKEYLKEFNIEYDAIDFYNAGESRILISKVGDCFATLPDFVPNSLNFDKIK